MEHEIAKEELISQAIRDGHWLFIHYKNAKDKNTKFWISIDKINIENKFFETTVFNIKNESKTDYKINFDKIQDAEISGFITPYEVSPELKNTLEACCWLDTHNNGNGVLNYYRECYRLDVDLSQKNIVMLKEIDISALKSKKKYKLNDEQTKQLVEHIYKYHEEKNKKPRNCLLGINELSLDVNGKLYVLTYYKVTFDPKEKILECDEQVSFNKAVLTEKVLLDDTPKASYVLESINMRIEDFLSESVQTRIEIVQDALNMQGRFRQVKIDTQPKIMILENCNNKVDLSVTYRSIEEKIKNNTQAEPLQSFFGRKACQEDEVREPSIIILDEKVNTSQMRVIYNTMKNPVTFVQGPPGTGKTQTIINVILSAFYSDKTVLVCSANNNPVDGIVNQLRYDECSQGKLRYKDRNIAFPILRLGNEHVMK